MKALKVSARPGLPRRNNIPQILNAAEKVFSARGLAGSRVDDIARACELPKANILYYFGTKEDLYRATLERLLMHWLDDADHWLSADHAPMDAVEGYVRSKMEFSRYRPEASRIFAYELLSGGEHVKKFLVGTLREHVTRRTEIFLHWQRQGLMAEVDPVHFLFSLWSLTQAYADMQVQMAVVLGTPRLKEKDFEAGVRTIMKLVSSVCLPGK
ncbi:TetR family transcriptional regulator C-terminal domain-containing protein [Acetobacter fallax]|uniref:TetR family transcriptional regulator n=1 Tax=Acetobacter fallax TaxID=1737473 RepID=A0ABX0KB05_9PROT|nr:TetR family transcriptional regulator [Acetobacter fallax]NHO36584.1 TetR family transcriptional regulator [Acetobacter fallax]